MSVDIDLSGGLDPEREHVFATQPDDPEMRESVNIWAWDDGGTVGMPRIGVEAVADQWDTHDVQVNIALAGGRVVTLFQPGEVHDPRGADGRARVLGAGPLAFELVEPFRHWRARLDGTATETTVDAQMAGALPGGGTPVPVELGLDIRSAAPPWEPGTLLDEAGHVLATQEEGALMGGPRFEQLFRTTGRLRVGDDEHEVRGGGLRIRRQGVRRLAAFRGHAWGSAVFPDGRAFGYIVYPPRTDGKPTFNEGYLYDGDGDRGTGALVPARVVQAPWLGDLHAAGEDVSVVLETERGTTTIHGETLLSTFMVLGPLEGFRLQQAIVRYTWDGQQAVGMLERSTAAAPG
jgi:hypothetical protein